MASLTPLMLIFASYFTFLLLATRTLADEPQKLLDHVCHQTNVYEFCIQALESNPKTANASTVIELSKIALHLAIQNTTSSKAHVQDLIGKSAPEAKKPLGECVDWYEAAIVSFKSAYVELEEDPLTANYDVHAAMDSPTNCEEALEDAKVSIGSVSEKNDLIMSFCKVGDVLTDMLNTAPPPL